MSLILELQCLLEGQSLPYLMRYLLHHLRLQQIVYRLDQIVNLLHSDLVNHHQLKSH
jgi:hypothetical protein